MNLACSDENTAQVTTTGYGVFMDPDKTPALQYSNMETTSYQACFPSFPKYMAYITSVCAQEKHSKCLVDAGSPIIDSASQSLVGVALYGPEESGCAKSGPMSFLKTSEYLQWIENLSGVTCKQ